MRSSKLLTFLIALGAIVFAVVSPASAFGYGFQGGCGGYNSACMASPSYVGPCDISGVTCVAYFAVQSCAQSAYSGNVIDVVDSATGNTTGTRLQCSGGTVSALVSGSACTFVTGNACSPLATTCASACTFSTVYNQMGTGTFSNLTKPATLANRSPISLAALNSKACFSTTATTQGIQSTSNSTLAQPVSIMAVAQRSGNFTTTSRLVADATGGNINLGWSTSANTIRLTAGVATQTATDSVFHSIGGIYNGASSVAVADGTAGSPGNTTTSWNNTDLELQNDNGGAGTGSISILCEVLITGSALNSTQYGALSTNARLANRWGSSF